MSTGEKVLIHIRKTIPNYIHNFDDFMVNDNNGIITIDNWNHPTVSIPTTEQLNAITVEEIIAYRKKIVSSSKIDSVESSSDVLSPKNGSISYINNILKVYNGNSWNNATPSVLYTETDIGNIDANITSSHLLGGIINGNPSGNRTWTLPSASSIITNSSNCEVGSIFRAVFNNDSTTKKITIVLGTGMTTRSGVFVINGHGTENSISSMTLMFRFDNIGVGTEAITVFRS